MRQTIAALETRDRQPHAQSRCPDPARHSRYGSIGHSPHEAQGRRNGGRKDKDDIDCVGDDGDNVVEEPIGEEALRQAGQPLIDGTPDRRAWLDVGGALQSEYRKGNGDKENRVEEKRVDCLWLSLWAKAADGAVARVADGYAVANGGGDEEKGRDGLTDPDEANANDGPQLEARDGNQAKVEEERGRDNGKSVRECGNACASGGCGNAPRAHACTHGAGIAAPTCQALHVSGACGCRKRATKTAA